MQNPQVDPIGIATNHGKAQSFETVIQSMSVEDLRALEKELDSAPPGPYSRADYQRRLVSMELQRREGDRRRAERTEASLEKLREERAAEQARLKSGKQLRPPVFVMGRLLPDTEIDTLQDLIRFTLAQEREERATM